MAWSLATFILLLEPTQMDYLKELNSEQRQAVEHTDGPVMIIAGAGSGKIKVARLEAIEQTSLLTD